MSSLVAVHSPPSETKIDAIPIGGPSDLRRLQVAFTSPSNTTPAPQRRLPQARGCLCKQVGPFLRALDPALLGWQLVLPGAPLSRVETVNNSDALSRAVAFALSNEKKQQEALLVLFLSGYQHICF